MDTHFETAVYDNKMKAFEAVKEFSRTHGFEITKRDCKAMREVYTCRKAGGYDGKNKGNTHQSKERNRTATIKENCPWRVVAKCIPDTQGWSVSTVQSAHTHSSTIISALSSHRIRALPSDQIAEILNFGDSCLPPKSILGTLRIKYGANKVVITTKDISNICQGNRLKLLQGRTPTQTLLDDLEAGGFDFEKEVDIKGK